MAYTLTSRAPGASNLTAKNRVWDFFDYPNKTRPANRRQPLQPRRKNRPTATKPASGIPYWPSRDPIGDTYLLFEDIQNLYSFIGNVSVDSIDLLGLTRIWGFPRKPASNCLGGAISGRGDVYAYPDHTLDTDKNFIDALKRGEWDAKEVKSKEDCKCACDEEKILITLYRNDDPVNKGKNPWTDPKFQWQNGDGKGNPLSDIHAIRAIGGGCSNNYHQIPRAREHNQEFDENIKENLFKGNPLLCACKKKK